MTIIVQTKQLNELCERIDQSGRFSMDLEFIPERTYDPELCLVQVAIDSDPFIVDPLELPELDPLWERVASPDILTVLHAAEQDLALVHSWSGLVPQNVMDTQIAAGFVGFGYPVGYGKLLNQLLGVSISKTESFTDWMNRPLTESQIDYALDDVRHLLPMYDALVQQLNEHERFGWVQEECKRYSTQDYYEQDKDQEFMRIKGASALSRRGLAVLKALHQWRDREAFRLNRPPRSILQDNILLELSRRPPDKVKDIGRIRGVRPDQINNHGQKIIEAVKIGMEVPDSELPSWPSFRTPPRRELLLGDMLFAVLKIITFDQELAPELVATRNDLQQLIRKHKEKKLDQADLPIMHGWRWEIIGSTLVKLLDGSGFHMWLTSDEIPVRFEIDQ
jgi:ribonuclease D